MWGLLSLSPPLSSTRRPRKLSAACGQHHQPALSPPPCTSFVTTLPALGYPYRQQAATKNNTRGRNKSATDTATRTSPSDIRLPLLSLPYSPPLGLGVAKRDKPPVAARLGFGFDGAGLLVHACSSSGGGGGGGEAEAAGGAEAAAEDAGVGAGAVPARARDDARGRSGGSC